MYDWRNAKNDAIALKDYLRIVLACYPLLSGALAHSERCLLANVGKTAALNGVRIQLEIASCAD